MQFFENVFSCLSTRKYPKSTNIFTSEKTLAEDTVQNKQKRNMYYTHVIIKLFLSMTKTYDVCVTLPYSLEDLSMLDIMALCQNSIRDKKSGLCIQSELVDFFYNNIQVERILGERITWRGYNLRDIVAKSTNRFKLHCKKPEHIFRITVYPRDKEHYKPKKIHNRNHNKIQETVHDIYTENSRTSSATYPTNVDRKKYNSSITLNIVPKRRDITLECVGVQNACENCWLCDNGLMCRNFLFKNKPELGLTSIDFRYEESQRLLEWKKSDDFQDPIYINIGINDI